MAGLHSPARICPKCGSEGMRRAKLPTGPRDTLNALLGPMWYMAGSIDRRRFGMKCADCGFHGVAIRRGVLDHLFAHVAVIALLTGIVVTVVSNKGGALDLMIFLSIAAAVVYMVGVWVIARLLTRFRARGSGAAGA